MDTAFARILAIWCGTVGVGTIVAAAAMTALPLVVLAVGLVFLWVAWRLWPPPPPADEHCECCARRPLDGPAVG